MSTVISAKKYKEITGLNTKKLGIFYAKKFGIKTNRSIKDKKKRYEDFLRNIRDNLRENDKKLVLKKVIDTKVYDLNTRIIDEIYLQNPLNRKIKTLGKIRNVEINIDNKFLHGILSKINNRKDKILMVKIRKYEGTLGDKEFDVKTYYFTVNNEFLNKLNENEEFDTYTDFSDISVIKDVKIYFQDKTNKNKKLEGGFFPYNVIDNEYTKNIEKILNRYQIYLDNNLISDIGNENCLIHALKLAKYDENKIDNLKLKCKSSVIPLTEIKKFAEKNSVRILVKRENNHTETYGKGDKIIKIGLLEDHYFLIEDVEITKFSIDNFEEVKKIKEWWKVSKRKIKNGKTYYEKNKKSGNDSFNLIKRLLNSSLVKEINLNNNTIQLTNLNKINTKKIDLNNTNDIIDYKPIVSLDFINKDMQLDNNDKYYEPLKNFKKLIENHNNKIDIKIAFDFETITSNCTGHKPFLVCFKFYKWNKPISDSLSIISENCEKDFLDTISKGIQKIIIKIFSDCGFDEKFYLNDKGYLNVKNYLIKDFFKITLFAHNITYDIQFLIKHVYMYRPIIRSSNKVCGGTFIYKGINYNLKDTYAIIDCKLSSFKDFFNFEAEKEVMPYELYTNENTKGDKYCKIEDALNLLKNNDDKKRFKENIKKWDLIIKDEYFDQLRYAKKYCEIDIDIMMKGYFIFREWVIRDFKGIDIDDKLTISSIADEYFKRCNCYDGCNYIHGIARYYIQQTVVGGRCMSRQNKMYNLNKKLNDFDGVSLYPSAMERLGLLGGYLKGKPKKLEKDQLNLKFLKEVDGYFVRIKLNKIRKERDFPLISFINSEGVRIFTNEINEENNILSVDRISLEDIMEYHEVMEKDFKILDGYYFDEGRNNNILPTIRNVFNLRLKHKKDKNPIQNLYKLVMNSSYGKTILKEQDTKMTYFDDKEKFKSYISRNYNHISECIRLKDCNKYLVKEKKPINLHKNACHIGAEILSMSKRIMNEVMCLAEDNDINIYYQDTDSMHIEDNKIDLLAKLYNEKYNRELIGGSMGQFHCDFEEHDGKKALYSIKTIILGKKAYYDKVSYDKENNITTDHYRMKGVPRNVVEYTAKQLYDGNVCKLYEKMYEGKAIKFDLLTCGVKFKIGNDANITNSNKFIRELRFNKNTEPEELDYEDEEKIEDVFMEIED